MKRINTIIIANNTTGEVAFCKVDESLEYNTIISSLEGLTIGPEKINDVDDIVRNNIKALGFSIEDINHDDVKESDMTIIIVDGMPLVWANTKDRNKAIFVGEIYGNCIDRFMAHNMNTFISNVRMQACKIENGNPQRMVEKNYHDSSVFETDFAALTELKELCLKMARKIQKLQENLTNDNYTA